MLAEKDRLTEQIRYKLQEIEEFCLAYAQMEVVDVPFVDQKQAELNNKQRLDKIKALN